MIKINKINLRLKKIFSSKLKFCIIKCLFPFRNQIKLLNISNRTKKNHVNLNYWNESDNLGDAISPLIVNYMLSLRQINPDKIIKKTIHLYAVGSVLTAGIQDATIWGSGILNAELTYRLKKRSLDIRSVRGPLTRLLLLDYGYDVPEIYGDPAILLPEIYNPKIKKIISKYGLVLHKDYNLVYPLDTEIIIIDIKTKDYKKFINQLLSVEIIISSSLHGIIIAEAYRKPAVLLKPQVDFLKYYDYYFSTDRYDFPIAKSIDDAKKIKPAPLPKLKKMKEDVKNAFPYDIYI